MLVYVNNFKEFRSDVQMNRIDQKVEEAVLEKLGTHVSPAEVQSWRNSLVQMCNALEVAEVPSTAGIAIEFQIPLTSKRVDVLVSGTDDNVNKHVVVVELKQWQSAQPTDKPGVVRTHLGGGLNEATHPSYQAWSYTTFIADYNEAVQQQEITLTPCSYLHNCEDGSVLKSPRYQYELDRAPLFLRDEVAELAEFISQYVKYGDEGATLYEIEAGRIRPSKELIEYLSSLIAGNEEFVLLDEQKIVAETILALEQRSRVGNRQVLIVDGGPGTGKSVLAVNLLAKLTNAERVAQYVTRNTAPRNVFEAKLSQSMRKTRISNLFKGSGSYINSPPRSVDALLVDEAHRLSPKSGFNGTLGENQVKEIIHASDCSVFFLDDKQQVIYKDIGSRKEIEHWADYYDADVQSIKLASQFRCNGSDDYLEWIDQILQYDSLSEDRVARINYDFQVFESPNELFEEIKSLDSSGLPSRLVAGYCWEWKSKAGRQNQGPFDIVIPEHDFEHRWNLSEQIKLWMIEPKSISEIGCIHTCQGLELSYVGVILGKDLVVRDGKVITDVEQRAKGDQSIRGYRKDLVANREQTLEKLDRIIKNTYRTLMTRGMKGCYVFSADPETNEYFSNELELLDLYATAYQVNQ